MERVNLLRRKRPLSNEVCERIVNDFIASDKVKPGLLLPSEKELTAKYDVSRVTLRAAIKSLHDRGLVSVRNGVGATVLPRPPVSSKIVHHLERLASLDKAASEAGKLLKTEDLKWGESIVTPEISTKLRLPVGDPVYFVQRSKVLDESRIAWTIDWLPTTIIDFNLIRSEFKGSLLDALLQHSELELNYADLEVVPQILNSEVAGHLGTPTGGPVLYLDTVVYGAAGQPDIWGQVWVLPEHVRFFIRRHMQF